jgi:glycosyltransferase involved in cell wall biosynthesis
LTKKEFNLIPVLFSHKDGTKEPYIRTTALDSKKFFELVYDRGAINSLHKKDITKRWLVEYLTPWIIQIEKLFNTTKPDIVFLNGFGLTNWMLLYVAHSKNVPVVIQHAGIWKKEIQRVTEAFSPAIRKIFYDLERDTARWCSMHVFLNTYSKEVFMNAYKKGLRKKIPAVVIPLPISIAGTPKNKKNESGKVSIGAVARWDGIKNHTAILRLASSKFLPQNWSIHTVTRIPKPSDFSKKYTKVVTIHEPMSPAKLTDFYASMDVTLLLSHFDVSPTVIAESFAAGTPVIISEKVGWQNEYKACGLEDHIVPTTVGGKTLVGVIKHVLLHQSKNISKYKNFSKYVRLTHSPKKVFGDYVSLFMSLTSK